MYDWDFRVVWEHRIVLLTGLLMSLKLTGACLATGTLPGIALGLLASSSRAWIRAPLLFLVDVIRSIPLLLLILFFYYGLPLVLPGISAFWSCVAAMGVNFAAFLSDAVRGAVRAVPRRHIEAARALGMSTPLTLRRIVVPHVARLVFPTYVLLAITMYKMSTLAAFIAIREVLHTANEIIGTEFRTLELYVAVAVMFVATIVPVTYWARRLERASVFAFHE